MIEMNLKPCPFCGGSARLLVLKNGVKVMCVKCDCQTHIEDDCSPISGLTPWRDGKPSAIEKVIEAWNKRVEPYKGVE